MKELSIEEKARRYNEAIEKFNVILNLNTVKESGTIFVDDVRKIFPELKESEDERIRKELIKLFKTENFNGYVTLDGIDIEDVLAWLEKQGESDETKAKMFLIDKGYPIDTNGIFPTYEEMYNIIREGLENQGEQKSFDYEKDHIQQNDFAPKSAMEAIKEERVDNKVEPKFHEGEWLIFNENRNSVYQVERIDNYRYYLRHYLGGTLSAYFDNELFRLWTIRDANPGDVIYLPNGNNEYYFFIFKGIENAAVMSFAHFYQYNDGSSEVEGTIDNLCSVNDVFQPATKVQRDLLFQKMKEAGYEWDSKKKGLKRIEQKPTWSKEDKKVIRCLEYTVRHFYEDEYTIKWCCDWLKSLRLQKQWKPSKEQIMALRWVLNHIPYDSHKEEISGLLDQIKDL